MRHSTRFIPPTDLSPWRLCVDVDDGSVDLIFGSPDTDIITVVDAYDEQVSTELATEFVAMNVGLLAEDEWRGMLQQEQAEVVEAAREARLKRRRARHDRWSTLLRRLR